MRIYPAIALISAISLILLPSSGLAADRIDLVRDLNQMPKSSYARPQAEISGKLLFSADDGLHGIELWQTTGTAASASLLKDINPGSQGSFPAFSYGSIKYNGFLYFNAEDATHGYELWKTDGTAPGTMLLKDLAPGTGDSYPNGLLVFKNILYFCAEGTGLWRSDGTTSGTQLIKAFTSSITGAPVTGVANPFFYLTADDGVHGRELWRSDGTTSGTTMILDIKSGSGYTPYAPYVRYIDPNGIALFSADDGTVGNELWRSDGTEAGTYMVRDIMENTSIYYLSWGSNPYNFTTINGKTWFSAQNAANGYELWQTNGTLAGTALVKDIYAGTTGSQPNQIVPYNNRWYFTAEDSTHGRELWVTTGTAGGTTLFKDLIPGINSSNASSFTPFQGNLFFNTNSYRLQDALWKTNGTPGGTILVKDFTPAKDWWYTDLGDFMVFNSVLYFTANFEASGYEMWKSDGTSAGTKLFMDMRPGNHGSKPFRFADLNGMLCFLARPRWDPDEGEGNEYYEFWKTSGTEQSSAVVVPFAVGSPTAVGNRLFFSCAGPPEQDPAYGAELWISNGTTAGTRMVKDIRVGTANSDPSDLVNMNGALLFVANDGPHGYEIWRSDGTETGTALVSEIAPGSQFAQPRTLINAGGKLFFYVDDRVHGEEVWISDGWTSAGTKMVKDINPSPNSGCTPSNLTALNDLCIFRATDSEHGNEIWRSDGTENGTYLLRDCYPGNSGNSAVFFLTAINDILFFRARDDTHGIELWKTGGTTQTTTMVKDIWPNAGESSPFALTKVGNSLFFAANDGTHGYELWKSDGTEGGTVLVKDICPGTTGSLARVSSENYKAFFVDGGGILYFPANDGIHGRRLWRSDGTAGGTRMEPEIPGGSFITDAQYASGNWNMTWSGGKLYFALDDGIIGEELYALTPSPAAVDHEWLRYH